MKGERQIIGRWGENLAAQYLHAHGYTILERNARTPYGEIDLVTCQAQPAQVGNHAFGCPGQVIVFIEVKTRRSQAYGLPEASITPRKRDHLVSAIQAYMQAHPELGGDWRLDVVAIQHLSSGQEPEIVHFENAIT
jgi:putative endonuclease